MIITKLNGGLGNQMFQYAVARSMADSDNNTLYLDYSSLTLSHETNTPRNYELYNFKIRAKRWNKISSMIFWKINRTFPILKIVKEKSIAFDPNITNAKGNIILDGYWQSEKYFNNNTRAIKNDFTFTNEIDKYNAEILKDITRTNSVSVHVRRGDYVSNKEANSFHGVCSIEYYKKAVKIIKKQVNNPKFFIFSDDPVWCQQNILLDKNIIFIDNTSQKSGVVDMQLMSQCKHNIIANSSFSWWGAWLNDNKSKVVIAPAKWFQDPTKVVSDIIPESWQKL